MHYEKEKCPFVNKIEPYKEGSYMEYLIFYEMEGKDLT